MNVCPVIGLSLPNNNLHGNIQEVMSTLQGFPYMSNIDFSNNRLFGDLPNLQFTLIASLNILLNDITGTIPDFQGMPNLRVLRLDDNQLKGTIPNFSAVFSLNAISVGGSENIAGDFST